MRVEALESAMVVGLGHRQGGQPGNQIGKPDAGLEAMSLEKADQIREDTTMGMDGGRRASNTAQLPIHALALIQQTAPPTHVDRAAYGLEGHHFVLVIPDAADGEEAHGNILRPIFIVIGDDFGLPLPPILLIFVPTLGFDDQIEDGEAHEQVRLDISTIPRVIGLPLGPELHIAARFASVPWQRGYVTGIPKNLPKDLRRQV